MKSCFTILLLAMLTTSSGQTTGSRVDGYFSIERTGYTLTYPNTWGLDTSHMFGADIFIKSPKENEQDQFGENVNVIVQDLQGLGIDLDKYAEISRNQIEAMVNDAIILLNQRDTIQDLIFHKIMYSGTQGKFKLKTIQQYFIKDQKAYVLTFTAETVSFDRFERERNLIFQSFRLK